MSVMFSLNLETIGGKAAAIMSIIILLVAFLNGYAFLHSGYAMAADVSALELRQVRWDLFNTEDKIDSLENTVIDIDEATELTTSAKSRRARLILRIEKLNGKRDKIEDFIEEFGR